MVAQRARASARTWPESSVEDDMKLFVQLRLAAGAAATC